MENLTFNNFPTKLEDFFSFFLQYEVLKIFAHKKLDKLCA